VRVYIAATPQQVNSLLAAPIQIDEYLTPEQFNFDNSVDPEEQEHLISLLAAEDALELNGGRFGLVIAADLDDAQLESESFTLKFEQVASILYSSDGESLSWFAPEEIQYQIKEWLQ